METSVCLLYKVLCFILVLSSENKSDESNALSNLLGS